MSAAKENAVLCRREPFSPGWLISPRPEPDAAKLRSTRGRVECPRAFILLQRIALYGAFDRRRVPTAPSLIKGQSRGLVGTRFNGCPYGWLSKRSRFVVARRAESQLLGSHAGDPFTRPRTCTPWFGPLDGMDESGPPSSRESENHVLQTNFSFVGERKSIRLNS
jgi:hypothetical protein